MAQNGLGQPIVDRNGNIKTDHKLVPEVLYDSATRIPIALIHQGINKYMEIVNSSADRYLAVIGLDPNTEEAKYKEHVKKAAKNFTAYMRVLLQSSGDIIKEGLDVFSKLMQDPEFKSVFDKFLQSLQERKHSPGEAHEGANRNARAGLHSKQLATCPLQSIQPRVR